MTTGMTIAGTATSTVRPTIHQGLMWCTGISASANPTEVALAASVSSFSRRAVIAASRHAEHGAVVNVLDELRMAGLNRVAFAVAPEGPQ